MAYYHRIAAIALALALAVGGPAAAAAQQQARPSSPASGTPCSEVCSGGGYGSGNSNTVGNPAPCSEVCSGAGYGLVGRAARIPPKAVRVVAPGAGFHWGDAGIGAAGMLALIVIGLGGALTLTRRRNQRIHG
jgi:hypothetical protein